MTSDIIYSKEVNLYETVCTGSDWCSQERAECLPSVPSSSSNFEKSPEFFFSPKTGVTMEL